MNPRGSYKPPTRLAGERLRPLGHLSISLIGRTKSPQQRPVHRSPQARPAATSTVVVRRHPDRLRPHCARRRRLPRREWDSNPRDPERGPAVFKTAAFVHSAIPPVRRVRPSGLNRHDPRRGSHPSGLDWEGRLVRGRPAPPAMLGELSRLLPNDNVQAALAQLALTVTVHPSGRIPSASRTSHRSGGPPRGRSQALITGSERTWRLTSS